MVKSRLLIVNLKIAQFWTTRMLMGIDIITDSKITELLTTPKVIKNPQARRRRKESHDEVNYYVADCNDRHNFTLYLRQNSQLADDFSCGLAWNMPSGEILPLVRYNGSSHIHTNRIEKNRIEFKCHIHKTTELYVINNYKRDGYAYETSKYSTLEEAFRCLLKDCNISGALNQSLPQFELAYEY